MAKKLPPVHPGEVLLEDFLKPLGLSQYRLARFFRTSDRFWLNLQAAYDLDMERDRLGRRLEAEVEVLRRAS